MRVKTEFPIATNSPDHLYPMGTAADNSASLEFVEDVEKYFDNKKITVMDVGCAGGQMIVDFHTRGHSSIGLEGSDYSIKHKRANWPTYHNTVLFTCDIAKPFEIQNDNGDLQKLDCITAWELLEHLHPRELDKFFTTIVKHMHKDSIFCGSIATIPEGNRHQSVFDKKIWTDEILEEYFEVLEYPFESFVRAPAEDRHFLFFCKLKNQETTNV